MSLLLAEYEIKHVLSVAERENVIGTFKLKDFIPRGA